MKNKKKNVNVFEDIRDIKQKSTRKQKKRARRQINKKYLKDISRGNIDPYLYEDFVEGE
jgi:hypothetical protein